MLPSVVQALHLMNSRNLQTRLSASDGRPKKLADSTLAPPEIVNEIYLACYSRLPKPREMEIAMSAFSQPGATRRSATEDVLWALLNSAEFVFNH